MSLMDKIYRVEQDGDRFYAVARDGELFRASGDPFTGLTVGAAVRGGLAAVTLLAPVRPSKIVCVGLNYKDHAGEVGKALPPEPLIFIKPPSAVIGPGDPIRLPPGVGDVHPLDGAAPAKGHQDGDGDACESLPGGFTVLSVQ